MKKKTIVLALCFSSLLIAITLPDICLAAKKPENTCPSCSLCSKKWDFYIELIQNNQKKDILLCDCHFKKLIQEADPNGCEFLGCTKHWTKKVSIERLKLELFLCEYHCKKITLKENLSFFSIPKAKPWVNFSIKNIRRNQD